MNDKQTIALELAKAIIITKGADHAVEPLSAVATYEAVLKAINHQWPAGAPS